MLNHNYDISKNRYLILRCLYKIGILKWTVEPSIWWVSIELIWFKTFNNWISIFLAWKWTLYHPFVKFTWKLFKFGHVSLWICCMWVERSPFCSFLVQLLPFYTIKWFKSLWPSNGSRVWQHSFNFMSREGI